MGLAHGDPHERAQKGTGRNIGTFVITAQWERIGEKSVQRLREPGKGHDTVEAGQRGWRDIQVFDKMHTQGYLGKLKYCS
jgi:hypothetical protein